MKLLNSRLRKVIRSDYSGNSLFHIVVYRVDHGKKFSSWVFDEPSLGIKQEPFVLGMDTVFDVMSNNGENEEFDVLFSVKSFPEYSFVLFREEKERRGAWYTLPEKISYTTHEGHVMTKDNPVNRGWLCPVLTKYFKRPPKTIYVRVKAL